jgi:hypothetical protein
MQRGIPHLAADNRKGDGSMPLFKVMGKAEGSNQNGDEMECGFKMIILADSAWEAENQWATRILFFFWNQQFGSPNVIEMITEPLPIGNVTKEEEK